MELAARTRRHRSPSHVTPGEKDKCASVALQTGGDNISEKNLKNLLKSSSRRL